MFLNFLFLSPCSSFALALLEVQSDSWYIGQASYTLAQGAGGIHKEPRIYPLQLLNQKAVWDFSGSPVVGTPRFHSCGPGVQSLVRELRSHMPRGMAKTLKLKQNKTKKAVQHLSEGPDTNHITP